MLGRNLNPNNCQVFIESIGNAGLGFAETLRYDLGVICVGLEPVKGGTVFKDMGYEIM